MESKAIVTINLLTYNSSKYVLEMLESIKAQTYKPLILHVCDDCSTDATVKMCRKWIEKNRSRFLESRIIMSQNNTGISGNLNRGLDACRTEWLKTADGDDVLEPDCIETYIRYVSVHPEATVVFSRVRFFCSKIDSFERNSNWFVENLSPNEWYERLITQGNTIPASTSFLNVNRLRELDVKADERLPLLEDYPMWINLANKGVKFHYIDKELVKYRVGEGGLSSGGSLSINYRKSLRKHYFYYRFPLLYQKNGDIEINKIVDYEMNLFQDIQAILNSPSYKIGSFLIKPFKIILDLLKNK